MCVSMVTQTRSAIRLIVAYKAEGGLSFNACAYHRATGIWRYHGNSTHSPDSPEISLTEMQDAIIERHVLGSRGDAAEGISAVDLGGASIQGSRRCTAYCLLIDKWVIEVV